MQRTHQPRTKTQLAPARSHPVAGKRQQAVESAAIASNQLRQHVEAGPHGQPVIEHEASYEQEADSMAQHTEQATDAQAPAETAPSPVTPSPVSDNDLDQELGETAEEFQRENLSASAQPTDAPPDSHGRSPLSTQQAARLTSLLRGGHPLEPALRRAMEKHFGRTFNSVRIHTSTAAAQLAQDLQARAFAIGSHIIFGRGRFQPDTPAGQRLLIHELTHVIQQHADGHQPRVTGIIQRDTGAGDTPGGAGNTGGSSDPAPGGSAGTTGDPAGGGSDVADDSGSGQTSTGGGTSGGSTGAVIDRTTPNQSPRITFPLLRVPDIKVNVHLNALRANKLYRSHNYNAKNRPGGETTMWDGQVNDARTVSELRTAWGGTPMLRDGHPYLLDFTGAARSRELARPRVTASRLKTYFGDGPMMAPIMKRPTWTRTGKLRPHDVDHRVELQVSGFPDNQWAHGIDNMELLDTATNQESGPAIHRYMVDLIQREVLDKPAVKSQLPANEQTMNPQDLMTRYDLYFEHVSQLDNFYTGNLRSQDVSRWPLSDINTGDHVRKLTTHWSLHKNSGTSENQINANREMLMKDIYDPHPDPVSRWPFNPHHINPAAYEGSSTEFVIFHKHGSARTSRFQMDSDRIRQLPENAPYAKSFVKGALVRMVVFYRDSGTDDRLGEVYIERFENDSFPDENERFEYKMDVPRYTHFARFALSGIIPGSFAIRGPTPSERTRLEPPPFGTGLRYIGQTPDLTYAYFSPVFFDSIGILQQEDELNLVQTGHIVVSRDTEPRGPGGQIARTIFAPGTAVPIRTEGEDTHVFRAFEMEDFNMPGPVRITAASLQVGERPETGFEVAGQLDFAVRDFATGYLRAAATDSGFRLTGFMSFDTRYFERAEVQLEYHDGQVRGEGTIAFGDNLIKGIKSGTVTVSYSNAGLEINGMADLDIPGIRESSLRVRYSEEDGLMIGGSVFIEDVAFISRGYLDLNLHIEEDGWRLSGEGNANLDIPGVDEAILDASYDDGYFHIFTEVVSRQFFFEWGSLQGAIRFGVTNKPVLQHENEPSSEDPSGEPDKTLRFWGGGGIDVLVPDWFLGHATLNFTENGEIEFLGRISYPQTIELIERDQFFDEKIAEVRSPEYYFGAIPVGGVPIPIYGQVGFDISADVSYGPGGLRDMALTVMYSSDPAGETGFQGDATLFMEFGGALVMTAFMRLGGGLGGVASIFIQLSANAAAILTGEAALTTTIRHTNTQPMSIAFTPAFRGSITGQLQVDADVGFEFLFVDRTYPIIEDLINLQRPLAGFGPREADTPTVGMKTSGDKTLEQDRGIRITPNDMEYTVPEEAEARKIGENLYSIVNEDEDDAIGISDPPFVREPSPLTTEDEIAATRGENEETNRELDRQADADRARRIREGEEILDPDDVPPRDAPPTFYIYTPYSTVPVATYDFTPLGGSGQRDFNQGDHQIAGFEVRRVGYEPDGRSADLGFLVGIPFGRLRGSLLTPVGDTQTLNVRRRTDDVSDPNYFTGEVQAESLAPFPLTLVQLGPIELNTITLTSAGLAASGLIYPTAPLLRVDLPIQLTGDTLLVDETLAGARAFELPNATIGDPANMRIYFDESGQFTLDDGLIAFEIPGFIDGQIRAPGGQQPTLSLPGELMLDSAIFDPATIPLTVDNDGPFANAIVRLRTEDIPDISAAQLIVSYDSDGLEALGPADIAVPFAVAGVVDMLYSVTEQGVLFTGQLDLNGNEIPGVGSGFLDIDTLWRKDRSLELTGHGIAYPAIPGVVLPAILNVHYEAGTLMISGQVGFASGAVSGPINVTIINRLMDDDFSTQGPPDGLMRFNAHDPDGLDVIVRPWLNGITHLDAMNRSLIDTLGSPSPISSTDFSAVTPRETIRFDVAGQPGEPTARISEPRITSIYSGYFGPHSIDWTAKVHIGQPRGRYPDIHVLYDPVDEGNSGVYGGVWLTTHFIVVSKADDATYVYPTFGGEDELKLIGVPRALPYQSVYTASQNFDIYWTANNRGTANPVPRSDWEATGPLYVREKHVHRTQLPTPLGPITIAEERHTVEGHFINPPLIQWEGHWDYSQQGDSYPITLKDVTLRLIPSSPI